MSSQKCSNCGKEIPSNIIVLHQRFCDKNTRKCSICEEPIQIDEYEEHKNKAHLKVKCEFCGKEMGEKLIKEHKKTCSEHLVNCKYCELSLPLELLNEHEYICGSKTEECPNCKILVPKCEYDLHLKYTCDIHNKTNVVHEKSVNEILEECLINNNKKVSFDDKKYYDDSKDYKNEIKEKNDNEDNIENGNNEVIFINDDDKKSNDDNSNNIIKNNLKKNTYLNSDKNDKNNKPVKYHKRGRKKKSKHFN